jgi:hypothetical protein
MEQWFDIDDLEIERLLSEWRWLCPHQMTLVARTAFGDLFLCDETDVVFWLNTAVGKLTKVANSLPAFRKMAGTKVKRREWFAEPDVEAFAKRGLVPDRSECIGFSVPLVFAESGTPDTPYVVNLYDHVAFLGDLNRQISSLPDGAKVRLRVEPPK